MLLGKLKSVAGNLVNYAYKSNKSNIFHALSFLFKKVASEAYFRGHFFSAII